jgi:hypothetical protein
MGRLATCLFLLAFVSSPALAKQGESAQPRTIGTIRIPAAFGVVTSTWRSVAHNRAVGGVPNSYHLQGRAIDIARRPGVTHRQIDAALRTAGYNLIESLDEGDHSHFAFGPVGARMAAGPAPIQYAPPPEPAKPKPTPVLADEHGTLIADLAPMTVAGASQAGSGPGLRQASIAAQSAAGASALNP